MILKVYRGGSSDMFRQHARQGNRYHSPAQAQLTTLGIRLVYDDTEQGIEGGGPMRTARGRTYTFRYASEGSNSILTRGPHGGLGFRLAHELSGGEELELIRGGSNHFGPGPAGAGMTLTVTTSDSGKKVGFRLAAGQEGA